MFNINNNKKTKKGKQPKFNFYWIYAIIAVVLISIALGAGGLLLGLKANGGWIVPTIGIVISAVAWINQARLNDSIEDELSSDDFREALEEMGEELESVNKPF